VPAFAPAGSAQQINTSIGATGLSVVATQGTSAASQTFTVNITGGSGTMLYSLSTDQPWLSVTPETGQTEGEVATGQIGLQLAKRTGSAFRAGTAEVAVLSFLVNSNAAPGIYPFTFTNSPIICAVADVNAYPLAGGWPKGNGRIIAGYEADVSPRPNGTNDGSVDLTDWVQVGRFAAGLDATATASEFQRADCAPRDILGDGILTVADWVQAGRYYAGADVVAPSGGPMVKATNTSFFGTGIEDSLRSTFLTAGTGGIAGSHLSIIRKSSLGGDSAPRDETLAVTPSRCLSIQNATFDRGSTGSVSVILQASGNENALGFSARFDPAVLRYVGAQVGPDAAGAMLLANTRLATNGELGIALAMPAGQSFASGNWNIVHLSFEAALGFGTLTTSVDLTDSPLKREMSSPIALPLTATYLEAAEMVLVGQVDGTAPTLTLTGPSPSAFLRTRASSLAFTGTATDNWDVTGVSWSNDDGSSGACTGTSTWSTSVIPLHAGTNLIDVRAVDPANNSGSKTITVVSIPMTLAEASVDSDGDGLSNWQEILAGTDPDDASSHLRITASALASAPDSHAVFVLSWTSIPGLSYSVWRAPDPNGPFAPVASGLIAVGRSTTHLDAPPSGSSCFYSIRMDTP